GPQFFEEFGGLSTRRILELAQTRMREQEGEAPEAAAEEKSAGFISTLAAALGLGSTREEGDTAVSAPLVEFRDHWDRFTAQSEAEIPSDDQSLMDVLAGALTLAGEEWEGAIEVSVKRLEITPDLPAVDLILRHSAGFSAESRIFLCNRATQG